MNSIHAQATALGLAFEAKGVTLSRSEKLETIAKIHGYKDFNTALASQSKTSEAEPDALLGVLRDLVFNAMHRGRKSPEEAGLPEIGLDAPGHSHRVAGVWDWDNGPLAGKQCQWCASWNKALSLIRENDSA